MGNAGFLSSTVVEQVPACKGDLCVSIEEVVGIALLPLAQGFSWHAKGLGFYARVT